ncbi:MAG TPA: TrkA family potassium uptake protein [Limnochordia bacterium]|nr:TrkA family potassium uptake protein [Limnochordia bacterium]
MAFHIGRGKSQARQFAVLGLGRFGSSLARSLEGMGHEVLGIDAREPVVQELSEELTHVVQADVTDEATLKALGLRNFDVCVVAIADLQPSILATMALKEFGCPYVVAKAVGESHGRLLERVGADRVVFPERDVAVRLAHNLVNGNVIDYLQLAPGYHVLEIKATESMIGHTLGELGLRARYGIHVLLIKRGEKVLPAPGANDAVSAGDLLLVMAPEEALDALQSDRPGPNP